MTNTNTISIEAIEDAYSEATGSWAGADWTHEYTRCAAADYEHERYGSGGENCCPHCVIVTTGDYEDPVMCDGDNDECQYCADASKAAKDAEQLAESALSAFRAATDANALDCAAQDAEAAAALESSFGDDPTWGPLARLMRDAADAAMDE